MSTIKVEKIQHPNAAAVALTLDTSGYLALQAGSASTPAIQGPSDPNTGIFFPAADTIAFAEGGTEALRIDSSGRVGIGTSSISNTLDIRATGANVGIRSTTSGQNQYIYFSNTADSTNSFILQTGSEIRIQQQDNVSGSRITFYTKDSERVRITDTGLVGVNTTTPLLAGARNGITLRANSSNGVELLLQSTSATDGTFVGYAIAAVGNDVYYVNRLDGFHSWITGSTGATERMRLDASGRLLVGTSTASSAGSGQYSLLKVQGYTGVSAGAGDISLSRGQAASSGFSAGAGIGVISFTDSVGYAFAQIYVDADGTAGANDYPGRIGFYTTADGASSPTERMRIDSSGRTGFGIAPNAYGDNARITIQGTGTTRAIYINFNGTDPATHITFANGNGAVGSITTSGSATAYNTSSDYRLKENVTAVTDGITRLQQLKPSRFNFIADPAKTVDGFLAHEVQTVVPEAITGEKDAVDDDGNPIYQGIDQSKLVPLLTAALQEAIGEIESLKARVAALESA